MIYFYPISKIGYIWEVSLLIKKVKTISNISYQPLFGWGLFIFGFLYFCCLGFHEPVWYDEGITLFHTNKSFHELIEFSKVDNNPPLFNILLYGWSKIFGYSILASRALSAIFMSITMVLIHSLGKKIYGSCYAIISVAFLFSFEAIIYYSVEIRSYGLMLMLAMCNLYALYTIYHKNNLLNSAMWVVSLVLLFFTHYAAGIFMSGSFLMILPYFTKWENIKKFALWMMLIGGIGLKLIWEWIVHPLNNSKDISDGSFWLKSPDWNMVQKSLTQFTEIFGLNFFFYFFILISGILIPILYVKDRRKNKKLLMFVSFLILLPGLSFVVSQSVPMFGFRYLLFLIPIFTITVFLILSYFPKKIGLGICAILFILSLRSTDVIYSRPDYNSLREMVLDQIKEDHAIIINESREALPYLINQNGNIFRSDVEFNLKCEDASIIRTSVKKFGEYSDLTYLDSMDELIYIRAGGVDPDGLISQQILTRFTMDWTNSSVHPFVVEKYRRMETIKKKPLIDLNLSPERIQEIDIKTNPFDHLKKQIFEYTEDKEFGVGIEIELNGKYKLNRLSYLQLELPINFSNISPECLLVAEVKDSLGNITSWEKVRLMDYYSDLGEWQNELVRIPVTAENGTKLKCYIWNNGMNSFRVKPFKTWLNRVQ